MVHCSAQTLSTHVIHKLSQACTMSQTQHGRMYRPKDASRLVLYLKDINLPKPDKYETAELAAFLQQLVTYQVCTEGVNEVCLAGVEGSYGVIGRCESHVTPRADRTVHTSAAQVGAALRRSRRARLAFEPAERSRKV